MRLDVLSCFGLYIVNVFCLYNFNKTMFSYGYTVCVMEIDVAFVRY